MSDSPQTPPAPAPAGQPAAAPSPTTATPPTPAKRSRGKAAAEGGNSPPPESASSASASAATTATLRASEVAVAVTAKAITVEEVALRGERRRMVLNGGSGPRRDASGAGATVVVDPMDVVRVELQNGMHLWMRGDDLLKERGHSSVARDGAPAAWDIDPAPPASDATDALGASERGVLGLGIAALEWFGVDLKQKSAAQIGASFELRQLKGRPPGLYRVTLGPEPVFAPITDGRQSLPNDRPLLVFLHGTMSSVLGSFGALCAAGNDEAGRAAASARAALHSAYGEHIYAFEHRSLTHSPIRNALDLLALLPAQARLHLVSHSRGGLVGELLGLAQRERGDDPLRPELLRTLFAADRTVAEQLGLGRLEGAAAQARDASYDSDRADLQTLVEQLDTLMPQVQRFVRVACPARGTTLASGRLDRWLSVLDIVTGNGIVGDVADFMLAVVKERTDPRTLPGVEAMMPGSALTRLLQHPALVTHADLSAIAGDTEPRGRWAQLKLLVADWFFGSDHDLVVNTGSMLGGVRRSAGAARWQRDQGEAVNHFSYFSNRKSLGWMLDGLTRADHSPGGFQPISAAPVEEPRWRSAVRASRSAAASTPRPIAVVLPGTMGSALSAQGDAVWLNYWRLLRGGLGDIGIDAAGVAPTALLDDFYGPLLEHLASTHQVEVFPYDWRRSVCDAAVRLTEQLQALLPQAERSNQPLHIVAHSMGGLVVRAMIADGDAGQHTWQRLLKLPGSRLLMLGTPNRGSHEAVRWLTGLNPTQAKLSLLDLTRGAAGVVDIVRRYPGLLELLPFDDASHWGQHAHWQALHDTLRPAWPLVDAALLRDAASTWARLRAAAPDPAHMVYVAGCQRATVIDLKVVDVAPDSAQKRIDFIASGAGDGTVSWDSGRLPGVPMYYAPDTSHDELCSNDRDRRIFRAYTELLRTGRTDQLSSTPPALARARGEAGTATAPGAASATFVLPLRPLADGVPSEAELRGLGFSGARPRRATAGRAATSTRIAVSIRHGDLSYARHPVMLGHPLGDTMVGAEATLDLRLDRALSRRRDLGLYPGLPGTHAVFFNERPQGQPAGAVVIGLGPVGEVTPGQLQSSVRDALLDYALQSAQRPCPDAGTSTAPADAQRRVSLSCLLMGTAAGTLAPREAIEALLRGAVAANRKLEDSGLGERVLIDQLELLELYEDVALAMASALESVLKNADLGAHLHWAPACLEEGEGRRQRRSFQSDSAWWQRLDISEDTDADKLRFVATADRARAEETLAMGQLRLVDAFVKEASASASSSTEVARTLFEMLLPNRIKEATPEQRDLVLVVDEASARFPWELLEDRWSRTGLPAAVAGGMVRQLKTQHFRAQPSHASDNSAFIVGNPDLAGWTDFPDLPGARREAEVVERLLSDKGYACSSAIDMPADTILAGLHQRAWRILHLAGHGEHGHAQGKGKTVSGMVIGRDTFLTPGDVAQMRHVPELVFINCCHLGKTQSSDPRRASYNQLAANLGVQFITMGVKAVVAAGWAVDDGAAELFADTFYQRLLAGDTFGVAVREARAAAWRQFPGANTWGAYQCYGDPGFRLARDLGDITAQRRGRFYSPAELVTELSNLTESVRVAVRGWSDGDAEAEALRERISALLARLPEGKQTEWCARADVAAALGFAHGEGGLFDDAVHWLDRALAAPRGDVPVRAVEQCAQFKVRQAALQWAALGDDPHAAAQRRQTLPHLIDQVGQAITELTFINQRAPTSERLALIGGAHKRLAGMHPPGALRHTALLNMASSYREAYDLQPDNRAYAFTNWALACLLLAQADPAEWDRGPWREAFTDYCDQQEDATRISHKLDPQFWKAATLADIDMVRLLLDPHHAEQVAQHAERALQHCRSAFERGASRREMVSVTGHLDFLVALTADWPEPVRLAIGSLRQTFR